MFPSHRHCAGLGFAASLTLIVYTWQRYTLLPNHGKGQLHFTGEGKQCADHWTGAASRGYRTVTEVSVQGRASVSCSMQGRVWTTGGAGTEQAAGLISSCVRPCRGPRSGIRLSRERRRLTGPGGRQGRAQARRPRRSREVARALDHLRPVSGDQPRIG